MSHDVTIQILPNGIRTFTQAPETVGPDPVQAAMDAAVAAHNAAVGGQYRGVGRLFASPSVEQQPAPQVPTVEGDKR
jgi:hypothetical protein